MSFRPEREKRGFIKVYFLSNQASTYKRNEFEPLCAALERGQIWYTAEDLHGDQRRIRLDQVQEVMDCSPEGLAQFDYDDEERKAQERLDGAP